jgi:HSP20 family protein
MMTSGLSLYRSPARTLSRSLFDVDRFFNDFHDSVFTRARRPIRAGQRPVASAQLFSPRVQATDTGDELRLVAEMPGVEAQDFEVLVEDDVLVLKGERKRACDADESDDGEQDEAGAKATASESFHRRFRFGSEIAAEEITARYKNGVLTVTLPKRAEQEPEARTIPVVHA